MKRKSASHPTADIDFKLEILPLEELKPHPKNYRDHPDDQLEHIMKSIQEHGFYRNIVAAKDKTILAGHGVVKAALKLGYKHAPVYRVDIEPDDPRALKILIGDNEIAHLGERNDRLLSELLKQIKDTDTLELLGTGYDEMMLANLIYVTRPASEIQDFNEAAEWVGMPEYDEGESPFKIVVNFHTEEDRLDFGERLGVKLTEKTKSMWWPLREGRPLIIKIRRVIDEETAALSCLCDF